MDTTFPRLQHDDPEVLVQVSNVGKKFCRDLKKSLLYGVSDIACELNPLYRNQSAESLRPGEFWANKDISFELRRGECLGLIGHNGAGKTTLLKMLNGLIKPDQGFIKMRGRIGALIALGAGFNPILTGRENIYVNASVLGLKKKEIEDNIDDIIEFAEIGEFIDSPVQSYSSGMQVRLGFAVATALKPDVLILDEVLAVGDAAFRAKCLKRIGDMANSCAVLFVSHDQSQVSRTCDKVLFLERGQPKFFGPVQTGLSAYRQSQMCETGKSSLLLAASIKSMLLISPREITIEAGKSLEMVLEISVSEKVSIGVSLISFYDSSGSPAGQADITGQIEWLEFGTNQITVRMEHVDLADGSYTFNVALFGSNRRKTLVHSVSAGLVHVVGKPLLWCAYKIPSSTSVVMSPLT